MYKIGVFIGNIDEQYQKTVWNGIIDEANEKKVRIICFPGLRVNYKENFENQANIVYTLVSKKNINGLIILSNTIFYNIKRNEILKFCNNYKFIPVVNFGFTIPGFTNIKVDSNNGIKELVNHLVEVHKYKKIAFIKGPHNHQEAENRFKVFCNELTKYKINIDNNLIIHGNFLKESGYQAAKIFIDDRKKDFDVIISANDSMAIGAMEFLQSRNIMVPEDIAVVGYDDTEECRSCMPRLTTIHQPIYEKGREAVSTILEIIEDGRTEKNKKIPSSLVIRQSCGCFSNLDDININIVSKNDSFYDKFFSLKKTIIEECKAPIGLSKNIFKKQKEEEWINELYEIYYKNIKNNDSNFFIIKLNDILKKQLYTGIDVYFWHNIISTLRRHTLKFSLNRDDLLKAECIWEQARIVIDEGYSRAENIKKTKKDKFINNMWEIGNFISSAFDKKRLIEEVVECLKRLDIDQCFFSIYENDNKNKNGNTSPEWSRLLLAIINGERIDIGEKSIRYKSEYLIPKKYFPTNNRLPLIIKPLYFRDEQFGFIIFEMKPMEPLIYDVLRQQISSALKSSSLMDEVTQHTKILELEVAKRTEDITYANLNLKKEIKQKKIIEIALKESEKNLRAITEATPIPLLIVSLLNGQILYSNLPFNITFGIDYDMVTNKKIYNFCVDRDHIEDIIDHLKKNENISDIELAVYHNNRTIFWVLASFQTLIFQGKKSFIVGFYDITKRKQMEKEILDISDREQSRIGQDLHDDLCQRLAGIAAMITVLENNLIEDKPDDSKKADQISCFLNDAIIQTKKLARGLYPVTLENNGLIYSIEELINKIELQYNISCKFYYSKGINIYDKSIALHLYRITQEAVYNTVKHAKSKHVFIKLISNKDIILLSIEDDGRGFNVEKYKSNGMGLKIMNYRSNMVGGKITVKSNNKGTIVTCIIKRKN